MVLLIIDRPLCRMDEHTFAIAVGVIETTSRTL